MTSAVDLHTRYGGGARNPSDAAMLTAIREVFHEDHPSLTEADYAEHSNSWLSYGTQNGDKWTVHTLDLFRGGHLVFSKYEDQDDIDAAFEFTKSNVTEQDSLRLWRLLAAGDIPALMKEDWAQSAID